MEELLLKLATCIEKGKVNLQSPFPPDMKGQEGAVELTQKALDIGIKPNEILNNGLMKGMKVIGEKFRDNIIFVPDVLISAKAMSSAMILLRPHFQSGDIRHKDSIALGTVTGDLHDIGKKLVGMVIEGGGWNVIDLGVDVSADKFIKAIEENSLKFIGMSALLTTTMQNMAAIVKRIKEVHPEVNIIIGGAPISRDFAEKIGADAYSSNPQGALEYINSVYAS